MFRRRRWQVSRGAGLLAALPIAYHGVPVQRCRAHKIRNVLDKVRKADRDAVKAGLHAVMNAKTRPKARSAARRFAIQSLVPAFKENINGAKYYFYFAAGDDVVSLAI